VHTIDDVVDALTWIVDDARERGDRLGLFAALYRRTTLRVRDAHRAGRFDDPDWVERLDVVFAVRYLEAYVAHRSGAPTTAAWSHAFARAAEPGHLVLQHLLMGMAAHILLDLGVATVGAEPAELAHRRADFRRIDAVLAHMLDDVQADLNRVSPAMAFLDRAGGRWDEALAEAALVRWRATAWRRATGLARTAVHERPARIVRIDRSTTGVARRLCPRPGRLSSAVWSRAAAWAHAREEPDVADVIDAIR
jgi:hypothetical protein